MKTILVCGLLGSGKTTFIRNLRKDRSGKTVVLVNDFGSAGIDGEVLSASGYEYIEMPNGCVCCSLRSDLFTALRHITADLLPKQLIIEPSGIAAPSGILEVLDSLEIKPVTVIGLIDASEFPELYESQIYGSFFLDQIMNSDIILLNKTDIAGALLTDASLELAERLNPSAIIIKTVHATLDTLLPENRENRTVRKKHTEHLRFDTMTIRLAPPIQLPKVKAFFEALSSGAFGSVVRAKALVLAEEGPFRLDLSSGQVTASLFDMTITDSRIVVIGEHLDKDQIKRFF